MIAHITTVSESPIDAAAALCAWDAHATGHRAPYRGSVPLDHGKALACELGREPTEAEWERFISEFHPALAARDGASADATCWDGKQWVTPTAGE